MVGYVEGNRFFENYRGPGDDFFGSVGSKPEIYPVYWSPAQMQARQSEPDGARAGLPQPPVEARVGRASSGSTRTATPLYPDRIRRRPKAPTPTASAPTSTRAPSTCG